MLSIDEQVLLNQLAQDIVATHEGDEWFDSLDAKNRRRVLRGLSNLIVQASPHPSDAAAAVSKSGMSATLTPCVMIVRSSLMGQLAKLAQLTERELPRVFRLLIVLLGIADTRRRTRKPLDLVNHWWHRDLSDPATVEEIKRKYG